MIRYVCGIILLGSVAACGAAGDKVSDSDSAKSKPSAAAAVVEPASEVTPDVEPASPSPTEDPRCEQARAAVASGMKRVWDSQVTADAERLATLAGIVAVYDLYEVGQTELEKYDCGWEEEFADFENAYTRLDLESFAFDAQRVQVSNALAVISGEPQNLP